MRKRFISGLTALCMLGILLANSFLSVPASAVIAEVGASVAAGLLMGTLFNQMTGGTGYDFTDAFADCFSFATKPHDQFIRDNPDADIYLPDGTPYYVDGQYVTGIDLKKGEAEITKMVQSHWNIAESLGLKTPQETIHAAMEAFNAGLADGSIVIHVDDDGNISMPTTSWCNSVTDIYDNLGVTTDNKGNRSATLLSVISPNIVSFVCGNSYSHNDIQDYEIIPFVINDDGFHCLNLRIPLSSSMNVYGFNSWTNYLFSTLCSCTAHNFDSSGNYNFSSTYSFSSDFSTLYYYSVCTYCGVTKNDETDLSKYKGNFSISGKSIDFLTVHKSGWLVIDHTVQSYQNFVNSYNNGEISYELQQVKIPLTDVENTIGNMGLAGVGSGATKGTVSVDSKTKDITVTNEVTKEAELVIEQSKPGDIDIPDNDTIIDKFPFSLPFDLYRMLTIFVVPEQKPIFKFPIETTITNGGLNYKIDEEIEVDLTRFQFMGQDIVRLVLRSTFYVGFVIMLIHVTSKFIKH